MSKPPPPGDSGARLGQAASWRSEGGESGGAGAGAGEEGIGGGVPLSARPLASLWRPGIPDGAEEMDGGDPREGAPPEGREAGQDDEQIEDIPGVLTPPAITPRRRLAGRRGGLGSAKELSAR